MTPMSPLYQITNLKYRYGEHFELDVPELAIEQGASIGFAGSNGSGKTTLLRLLAFVELPEEGNIRFEGADVTKNGGGQKRDVTMLLQEPYLLKRSVFENIAFGLKIRDDRKDLKQRVYGAMELVGMSPRAFARRHWHELSGGGGPTDRPRVPSRPPSQGSASRRADGQRGPGERASHQGGDYRMPQPVRDVAHHCQPRPGVA